MIKYGIVLRHDFSRRGIEVDKSKVEVIAKLPEPKCIKNIRSFLGHADFYSRFIKVQKNCQTFTNLLGKDVPFYFDDGCLQVQEELKQKLVSALIISASDWTRPFEVMSDASDFAIGIVLGQHIDNRQHAIYYASRTLNESQLNYTTTEKNLAAVFALEKFHQYLLGSKTMIFTDHSALIYFMQKKTLRLDSFVGSFFCKNSIQR